MFSDQIEVPDRVFRGHIRRNAGMIGGNGAAVASVLRSQNDRVGPGAEGFPEPDKLSVSDGGFVSEGEQNHRICRTAVRDQPPDRDVNRFRSLLRKGAGDAFSIDLKHVSSIPYPRSLYKSFFRVVPIFAR